MDTRRFAQVERLFHEALKRAPGTRAAFLAQQAPQDAELRRTVQSLLEAEAHERSVRLFDRVFVDHDMPALPPSPTPGQHIAHYRLVRELGRGSTGLVFEADDTHTHRRVALKLLYTVGGSSSGASGDHLVHEATVLGRLDHPTIAAVYGAGRTDAGQPYVVMELVAGQRLDRYARRHSRAERLDLFLRICDGIAFAHEAGVIHRDLKPSNVIVKDLHAAGGAGPGAQRFDPVVKILDFGLAKLVDREATLTTLSGHSEGWGTLPYMSPEQRRGERVDHRTDVYSLGVMLFKLMTEQLPYAVEGMSLPEAWYHIEHQTPRRPSQIDPALRGDLETIILNATAESPRHRYQSAQELGEDVRRYLSDQRPLRRPPSVLRELGRFVKRNRGLAATVGGIIVGLLATTAGTAYGLYHAQRIVREAESLRDARRDVLIFIGAEADEIRRAVMEGRPRDLPENFRPNIDAVAYQARRVRTVDQPEEAARTLTELVQIAESTLPPRHWYTAVLRSELGACLTQIEQYARAERHLREAYDDLRWHVGSGHGQTERAAQRMEQLYRDWGQPERLREWRAHLAEGGAAVEDGASGEGL